MITLEPVTGETLDAALALRVAPEQERLVSPVATSLAEASVHGDAAWDADPADLRSGLWRLNVDRARQGRGYGRFAVLSVCDELRRRGADACYVTYHLGDGTPELFYRRLGFEVTGETSGDQTVARRALR